MEELGFSALDRSKNWLFDRGHEFGLTDTIVFSLDGQILWKNCEYCGLEDRKRIWFLG